MSTVTLWHPRSKTRHIFNKPNHARAPGLGITQPGDVALKKAVRHAEFLQRLVAAAPPCLPTEQERDAGSMLLSGILPGLLPPLSPK